MVSHVLNTPGWPPHKPIPVVSANLKWSTPVHWPKLQPFTFFLFLNAHIITMQTNYIFCTNLIHHSNLEKQGQTGIHLVNMNPGIEKSSLKCYRNTSAGCERLAVRCCQGLQWQLNSRWSWPTCSTWGARRHAFGSQLSLLFRLKWGHVRSAPPPLVYVLNNECSSFLYN